jgi:protein SCO1/2
MTRVTVTIRAIGCLVAVILCAPGASANTPATYPAARAPRMEAAPDELKGITIDERLNQPLPLDVPFVDEMNRQVTLRQYFGAGRPVVLQLGYYGCPMLCDLISKGLIDSMKMVELEPGRDYELIFVSIDPNERWDLAQKKKRSYVQAYGRGGAESGWHFLTGQDGAIRQLAAAVGFQYKWVASVGQYSHPAAIFVCTPDGKLSRYLYGVRFDPQTVRLSLVEASAGKIGTTTDRFLLTCFQYDGRQGKYAMAAMTLMRLGGALTAMVLGGFLFVMYRRESRRRRHSEAEAASV